MQSRPADKLHCATLQVEIPCEYCLDVLAVRLLVHRLAEFDNAAELVSAVVLGIGQDELCVVLRRHVRQPTESPEARL